MTKDEQFKKFEGLAVKASARVFGQWRESLTRRGVTVEDAVQEGRLALIELLPRLDDPQYVQQQQSADVVSTVGGRLRNWAVKQSKNGDARDPFDPPPQPDPGELMDLRNAMADLDPTDAAMVLSRYDGMTYREIGRKYGLSAGQAAGRIHKAMAMLRKKMNA